jgi:hypothetical protein
MPRLGSFLICEKLIIDQQQKPTLISVFQTLSALIPEAQTIPKDTISFTAWSIFCEWFFTNDERKEKVEQVVQVLHPDGSPAPIGGRLMFQQIGTDGMGTRSYVNLLGMPIAQPGFVTVNVWLEVDSEKLTDVFSYRIKIEHTKQPPMPNDGGTITPAFTQAKPS